MQHPVAPIPWFPDKNSTSIRPRRTAQFVSCLTVFRLQRCYDLLERMAERNKHPEIDIPTPPQALIGLAPEQPLAEPAAESVLDIPTIIRAFQTDAYPLPDGAPLRIAVSNEASLTLYPRQGQSSTASRQQNT
jgi:hypothetical protein